MESIEVRLNEINMERLQNKREKLTSQKQDDQNVRIDKERVAACPYVTPPDDMEEGVCDEKDDNTEILDEGKEAKFPDVTSPIDM